MPGTTNTRGVPDLPGIRSDLPRMSALLLSHSATSCLQLLLQTSFTLSGRASLLLQGENGSRHLTSTYIQPPSSGLTVSTFSVIQWGEGLLLLSKANPCPWGPGPSPMDFPRAVLLHSSLLWLHLWFLPKVTPRDPPLLVYHLPLSMGGTQDSPLTNRKWQRLLLLL